MKFIFATLAIAVLGFGVQLVLPWWSLALVAFLIGFVSNLSGWAALAAGFLGSGSVWALYALMLNTGNDSLLAHKMAALFGVPSSALLLVAISALIAALLGGFAAAGGRNLKQLVAHK
jgi:hypothetical protein